MSIHERRYLLHNELLRILGDNTRHVYFQPPENLTMEYPCIVYERHDIDNVHANNEVYLQGCRYRIIVIDKNPDSLIVERMSQFPTARHEKHYVVNGLHHDTFIVIF